MLKAARPAAALARRIAANIAKLPNLLITAALSKEDSGTWPGFGSNSGQPTTGERMDVWWEILFVLAPGVSVMLLALMVLYVLSRPGRPQ